MRFVANFDTLVGCLIVGFIVGVYCGIRIAG